MIVDEIREELLRLQDIGYRDFQSKLIPTADPASFVGVRTPELRALAKRMAEREDIGVFLGDLPHTLFDENQLHAFIVSGMKGFEECIEETERFLPYVDNWATCDQMSPKVFKKNKPELLERIDRWIASGETYTVRFGVGMLMEHFLDEAFDPALLETVAGIRSEEYYVRMMVAWFFATALAKRYEESVPYLEVLRLDAWTHNKAIQKAVESRRLSPERKEYLRTLKVKPSR